MRAQDLPIALADVGDAQAMAVMSRDLIEIGLGWEYRKERVAAMIVDRAHVAIVARHGARVAGFAIMSFGDERGHLVLLAVQAPYRRTGIARRMLAWLGETALVAGMASLHVELRVTNLPALALYQNHGYAETIRVPRYYRGKEACVRMVRLLRNPTLPLPAWEPRTLDGPAR